jgi:preprotein translocase subunit YajC
MGAIGIVLWLVALLAAFFFLIVRPQRRQMTAHRALVESLAVGDEVISTSGIIGVVRALHDETLDLEIATGVVVKLARGAVGGRTSPPDTSEPGTDAPGSGSASTDNAGEVA